MIGINKIFRYAIPILGVAIITLYSLEQFAFVYTILAVFIFIATAGLVLYNQTYLVIVILVGSVIPFKAGLSFGHFVLLLYSGIILIRVIIEHKLHFYSKPAAILLISLLALAMMTVGKWTNIKAGLLGTIQLVITPILLIVLLNSRECKVNLTHVLQKGFPLLAVILSLSTFFVMIEKMQLNVSLGLDIMGFHNIEVLNTPSNRLAGLLAFLALCIYTTRNILDKRRVISSLNYAIITTALVLSFLIISRGAILSLICGIAIIIFGQLVFNNRSKILKISLIFAVIISLLRPFWEMFYFRISNIKVDLSHLYRLAMWWDSLMKIKMGPIIGSGPGQYLFNNFTNRTNDPHNMFLRYGVELGGVSIIILIALMVLPILYLLRLRKRNEELFKEYFIEFTPPLVAALFHSQIDIIITSPSYGLVFWVFWGIAVRKVAKASVDNMDVPVNLYMTNNA